MGCCSCCAKWCACAILAQLVSIACVLAIIPASYLSYEYYLKPWGEKQLANAPTLSGLSCADCSGVNLEYPVSSGLESSYTELEVFLINEGGRFVSSLTSVGVAVGGCNMLFALISAIMGSSSASSASSSSGGGSVEALLMISQGQFITLLGSLSLEGAPVFFFEFCKKFAWTNLQIFPQETSFSMAVTGARLLVADDSPGQSTLKGVPRYAQLVGVNPDHLFYYTCLAVAAACAAIVVLYFMLRFGIQMCKKDHDAITEQLDNRVIWTTILLLSVLQYVLAMTSCFQIYYSISANRATGGLVLALVVLLGSCFGFVGFGVLKVSQYQHELDDLGSDTHEKKPFNHKYGAYYEDFTKENKFFFVAKIGLEIASGAVIGTVQDPVVQIGTLVGLNAAFLLLVIVREPFLIRLFYYVAVVSGYVRVVLLLLSIIQSSPDIFPQHVRNLVAEIIIGLNALLFVCLLIRQIYAMSKALCKWCQAKGYNNALESSLPSGKSGSQSGRSWHSRRGESDSYEEKLTLQQLIASKIRDDPPVTPPIDSTPPSKHHYRNTDRFAGRASEPIGGAGRASSDSFYEDRFSLQQLVSSAFASDPPAPPFGGSRSSTSNEQYRNASTDRFV